MAEYRARLNYMEMAKDTLEIGGGFIASGFTGRYIENKIKPDLTAASSTTDKIIAGVANNGPKVALYYVLHQIGLKGAAAAIMGSIGFDVLIRATNQGVNTGSAMIKNYRVLSPEQTPDWAERQKNFASMPTQARVLERQRRYGAMPLPDRPDLLTNPRYGAMPFQQNPEKTERQRRYGTMPFQQSPETIARQRRYGSMVAMGFNVDRREAPITDVFGMQ